MTTHNKKKNASNKKIFQFVRSAIYRTKGRLLSLVTQLKYDVMMIQSAHFTVSPFTTPDINP